MVVLIKDVFNSSIRVEDNSKSIKFNEVSSLHTQSMRSSYRDILSEAYLYGQMQENCLKKWEQRLCQFDQDKNYIAGVFLDEQLAGFAYGVRNSDGVFLDNLHVNPDLKGFGIGSLLLSRVSQWAAQQHSSMPLSLEVYEKNVQATGFYRKLGGEFFRAVHESMPHGTQEKTLSFKWKKPSILAGYDSFKN